eukprot:gene16955-18662_t
MPRSRSRSRDRSSRRRYSSSSDDSDRYRRDKKKKRRRSSSKNSRSSSRSDRQSDRDRQQNSRRRGEQRGRSRSRSPRRRSEKSDRREEKADRKEKSSSSSLKERVAKLVAASSSSSEVRPTSTTSVKIDRPSAETLERIESKGFEQQTFTSTAKADNESRNANKNASLESEKSAAFDSHQAAIFGTGDNGNVYIGDDNVNDKSNFYESNGQYFHTAKEDDLLGPIFCIDQNIRAQRWLEKLSFIRKETLLLQAKK